MMDALSTVVLAVQHNGGKHAAQPVAECRLCQSEPAELTQGVQVARRSPGVSEAGHRAVVDGLLRRRQRAQEEEAATEREIDRLSQVAEQRGEEPPPRHVLRDALAALRAEDERAALRRQRAQANRLVRRNAAVNPAALALPHQRRAADRQDRRDDQDGAPQDVQGAYGDGAD